jgi:simple sugar transport system ATP-binding protein
MSDGNGVLLQMSGVLKRFGKSQILKNIDFTVNKHEIVGLLGDNGAGKTTLIKVLVGLLQVDGGEIYFEGKKVRFKSPNASRRHGIEVAYQGLALVPLMDIVRNFFLGREMTKRIGPFNFLDKKKMAAIVASRIQDIGIKGVRDVFTKVATLSGGESQSICIGRAVHFGAKLLILDEPTAALSINESNKVLEYVIKAKESGLSVIFVTHNPHHVYQVADRFVILSEGKVIGNFKKRDITPDTIIDIICGEREKKDCDEILG